jgi:5-methylcytosine-specific restriction enzyme A
MPHRAPRFCLEPGCSQLVTDVRCPAHTVPGERLRPNLLLRRWYRTPAWKALRARILREQAYQCAECRRVTIRLDVDHITPHQGDQARFWDRANLQALCRMCHTRKTRRGE